MAGVEKGSRQTRRDLQLRDPWSLGSREKKRKRKGDLQVKVGDRRGQGKQKEEEKRNPRHGKKIWEREGEGGGGGGKKVGNFQRTKDGNEGDDGNVYKNDAEVRGEEQAERGSREGGLGEGHGADAGWSESGGTYDTKKSRGFTGGDRTMTKGGSRGEGGGRETREKKVGQATDKRALQVKANRKK